MRSQVARPGAFSTTRAVSSMACIAFVMLLSAAFWAGALWIGEALLRVGSLR